MEKTETTCARYDLLEEETFKDLSSDELALFDSLACRIRDNLVKAVEKEAQACPWF